MFAVEGQSWSKTCIGIAKSMGWTLSDVRKLTWEQFLDVCEYLSDQANDHA